MEFKNGYLGLAIVVLALFGSILIGFVGNLQGEEITQTVYRDATDVSSLYDYNPVNAYIEYTPNSNWTGWDDIGFDNNPGQNQYLWSAQSERVNTFDISMGSTKTWSYSQGGGETHAPYFNVKWSNGGIARMEATSDNPIKITNYQTAIQTYIDNGYVTSGDYTIDLSGRYAPLVAYAEWETSYFNGTTYGETINDPSLGDNTINKIYALEYRALSNTVNLLGENGQPIVSAVSPDKLNFYWGGVYVWTVGSISGDFSDGTNTYGIPNMVGQWKGNSRIPENAHVSVNDTTDTYHVQARNDSTMYWTTLSYACMQVGKDFTATFNNDYSPIIILGSNLTNDKFNVDGGDGYLIGSGKRVTSIDWVNSTRTLTLHYYDGTTWTKSNMNEADRSVYVIWGGYATKTTLQPAAVENITTVWRDTMPAQYIDIDNGVYVPSDKTTINWANGWNNGTITILVTDVGSSPFIIKAGDVTITITTEIMYMHTTYYYVDVNGNTIPVGLWKGVEITLNPMDREVSWKPLKSIAGFRQYTVDTNSTTVSAEFGMSYLTGFSVTNTVADGKPRFGVVSTYVNMDDSQILMDNPTINLGNLYPDKIQQGIKVTFSNAIKYGSSFTVGGKTYNIVDEKVVTDYGDYELQNVVIYFSGDGGQITFDSRVAIPFKGEPTISFNGVWYFQTTMATAKELTEHVTHIDAGNWNMDQTTFIIIFVVITLIGCAIGQLAFGFRILDVIFVGGGLLISMAIIGM